MRRSAWVLLCIVAVLIAGCRKKSSPEYYEAEGRYSVVLARLGDDAYADPELRAILELLKRVPPNAREADQATALTARITAEAARVEGEVAVRARAVSNAALPSPPGPSLSPLVPVRPVVAGEGTVDAGPPPEELPVPGMPEAKFMAKFGKCLGPGAPLPVPGQKEPSTAYMVLEAPECQKKYGVAGGKLAFVVSEGRLQGTMVRTETKQTVILDAGLVPTVTVQDGGGYFMVPGLPLPGYVPPDSGS